MDYSFENIKFKIAFYWEGDFELDPEKRKELERLKEKVLRENLASLKVPGACFLSPEIEREILALLGLKPLSLGNLN